MNALKSTLRVSRFKLAGDTSRSVSDAVNGLLDQAVKRQKQNPGMKYAGTLLATPCRGETGAIDANGRDSWCLRCRLIKRGARGISSLATRPFTAPPPLRAYLSRNVSQTLATVSIRSSLLSTDRVVTARSLLEDAGIGGRVEVWDLQQFLSINVYEHGLFSSNDCRRFLADLISGYNGIIDECETDPSLHIEYAVR